MGIYTPSSLKKANLVGKRISCDLARFERSLANVLDVPVREHPGSPGSGPIDWSSADAFEKSYLFSEMLSKFDDGQKNPEKDVTTWAKFHEAERLCFETNQRLYQNGLFKGPYKQAMVLARKISDRILGRFDWDAAEDGFGWGPGASTRLPRRKSDAAYKFSGNPESTIGNAALAHTAICRVPSWKRELDKLEPGDVGYCKIVPGNRIVTVPKNYKTDRTIAIEPCMNMYIQKGIGALMRKRLARFGCDLNDQTRNQRLAKVGAVSGRLATIDLSMASDTVSRVLVTKFIRSDWLEALEQSRSPFGVLPSGEKIFYQKFSSMGNGFTFELESLIFYSLALAWCHVNDEEVGRVSVYGDDIILPSAVADSFCGLLQFCGFTPNEKKSYWSGPFRESCGKHYYLDRDVTPFYVRRKVDKLSELFLLHNNLLRWSERTSRQGLVHQTLQGLKRLAPAKWRKPRIPDGYGDGAFISLNDEWQHNSRHHPDGWEFWVSRVLLDEIVEVETEVPGLLIKSLINLERNRSTLWAGQELVSSSWISPSKAGRKVVTRVAIPQFARA